MTKYLVTGGAGFIGSHIVEELVRRGEAVRVLDDFSSGTETNLLPFKGRIEVLKGDVCDQALVKRAVAGMDFVLHQAALRSVPKSFADPMRYHDVNVGGTLHMLLAAAEANVKRVVFASSSSVYGNENPLPLRENQPPGPISPYAATKLAGEVYCKLFAAGYGLETVSLRYFNVFGPRQSLESQYAVVVPKFITNIMRNEAPPIHGDGKQSRDFTFVANVVAANLAACAARGVSGRVFNIACGEAHTVLALAQTVNRLLNKAIAPAFLPKRPGDVLHTQADIASAKQALGQDGLVSFEEGLRRTVDWFLQHAS